MVITCALGKNAWELQHQRAVTSPRSPLVARAASYACETNGSIWTLSDKLYILPIRSRWPALVGQIWPDARHTTSRHLLRRESKWLGGEELFPLLLLPQPIRRRRRGRRRRNYSSTKPFPEPGLLSAKIIGVPSDYPA